MRKILLSSVAALFLSAASANAQVICCAPPPPVGGGASAAAGGAGGATAAFLWGAYVSRGIGYAWHVGEKEKRQLVAREFLFWPIPTAVLSREERFYARVARAYDMLPRRRDQFFADVIGDRKPWTYPSLQQMLSELRAAGVRIG